jgi:hypothetical protein
MIAQPRTFPCPACNEIINDISDTCRFCSTPVDRTAAVAAADFQERVNRACSDGSFLKTMAVTMFIFLGLSFVPFLPLVEYGFLFLLIAVPVMIIRWQVRFGGLETGDPDYRAAKRARNIAITLWFGALVVYLLGSVLYALLIR